LLSRTGGGCVARLQKTFYFYARTGFANTTQTTQFPLALSLSHRVFAIDPFVADSSNMNSQRNTFAQRVNK
jgi:hypothetical protein